MADSITRLAPTLVFTVAPFSRSLTTTLVRENESDDGAPWFQLYRGQSGYVLTFPGFAHFLLSDEDRSRVWVEAIDGVSPGTVEHLFRNHVLPMLRAEGGDLVLHGGAIEHTDAAILFLGISQRGKSTLVTSFALDGVPLCSDDALVIDTKAAPLLLPGEPSIRLWGDSAEALFGAKACDGETTDLSNKQRFIADASLPHVARALPIRAGFVLENDGVEDVVFTPMASAATMLELVGHSFLFDTSESAQVKCHFMQLFTLVQQVPFFRLDYPRRYEALPLVRSQILQFTDDIALRAHAQAE